MKYSKDRSLRDQLAIAKKGKTERDRQVTELLDAIRHEAINRKWASNGPAGGYWECARGADRPLSDEAWAGLLSASEIRDRLKAYGFPSGDYGNRLVRRLASKLGITLAKERPGRKARPKTKASKERRKREVKKLWKLMVGGDSLRCMRAVVDREGEIVGFRLGNVSEDEWQWQPPKGKKPEVPLTPNPNGKCILSNGQTWSPNKGKAKRKPRPSDESGPIIRLSFQVKP